MFLTSYKLPGDTAMLQPTLQPIESRHNHLFDLWIINPQDFLLAFINDFMQQPRKVRHSTAMVICIQKATRRPPSSIDTLATFGRARTIALTAPTRATPIAQCIASLLKRALRTATTPKNRMSTPKEAGTKAVGALHPVPTNPATPKTPNKTPKHTAKTGMRLS